MRAPRCVQCERAIPDELTVGEQCCYCGHTYSPCDVVAQRIAAGSDDRNRRDRELIEESVYDLRPNA